MFWQCFFPVTTGSLRAHTLPLQFEPNAYPTPKSDTMALFVNDTEYKVYLAKLPSVNALYCPELIVFGPGWSDYDVERMGWFYNWRWHTTHADEHIAFYKKRTPEVLKPGRIKVLKEVVISHKLHGYSSMVVSYCHKKIIFKLRKRAVFEMFSTPTLRMESYSLKFDDDLLLCIVVGLNKCLSIHAWGKSVWSGVDTYSHPPAVYDVLLPDPMLKRIVPYS
ncbi:hypothetical protein Tco_1502128 [Tanacetum coccineum]